jgi:hypothetical protein
VSAELSTSPRFTDPGAIRELRRLFTILERLDIMAHDPPPDGMVKVTAIMWRDQISPSIRRVQTALEGRP